MLGYFLGQIAFVRDNIEPILIAIVLLSAVPVAIELLRARRDAGRAAAPGHAAGGSGEPAAERAR